MKITQLITDDDAVSPVIGVILMVAITVILAAVIGTFVLGLGDQVSDSSPQASFSFAFEDSSPDELTITHDGGDSIAPGQLSVKSDTAFLLQAGNSSSPTVTSAALDSGVGSSNDWVSNDVTAGTSFTISGDSDLNSATVRVTWQASSGGDTATLGKWSGPSA